ncbi:hypothetical protein JYT22_00085 [Endomicrobium sp. AH-315-J14]|nr:hypothetical protein [Endomicrobium sp. AH-315-J14]
MINSCQSRCATFLQTWSSYPIVNVAYHDVDGGMGTQPNRKVAARDVQADMLEPSTLERRNRPRIDDWIRIQSMAAATLRHGGRPFQLKRGAPARHGVRHTELDPDPVDRCS